MTALSELFQRIHRIEISTRRLVEDLLQGAYRSAFKGNGLEFDEVRPYEAGDEVRNIDWNVTARHNSPYVKSYIEERELTVMLLIDLSSSLRFGSCNRTKQDLVAEIAAVLAFSAIKNQDKVGVILFTDRIEKYIPPKKGTRHVLRVIREILGYVPEGKGTDLACALSYLRRVQERATVSFLISDFITDREYEQAVKVVAKRHDLIAIAVVDPREQTIPSLGIVAMEDLETQDQVIIDFSDSQVQKTFQEESQNEKIKVKRLMTKIHAGYLELVTNQPYEAAIRKYFSTRKRQQ